MSQTLSLQPGKYALFITPPVAGVDYTGTPLPTVSYQWKKNGTAIAGQTNATISGVWVEQSGGTVDLVDGDVISIDIILTNPVSVATKTISATIDSAIPAPVISPVSIRQLSGGTYQTVTSLANTDIGEQVIVASNTGGTVTTTPPVLTTYQWRRGFAPIAGATSQTYTLQAADADSIIDCVVTASNAGGTTTASAAVTVGTLPDAGWTTMTPSSDSRLIYVSNDGNDTAASTVYGRGYYLPSDPEIGPDPTNPVGPIVAYKSLWRAETRLRRTKYLSQNGNIDVYGGGYDIGSTGYPDWLLMRRGDTFSYTPESGYGNGVWPYATNMYTTGSYWMTSTGQTGGTVKGRSESEPVVVTAWGNPSDPRPIRLGNMEVGGWNWHVRYVSIDLTGSLVWKGQNDNGIYSRGIWLEDCRMRSAGTTDGGSFVDCRLRRCVISGSFNPTSHNQGMFISNHVAIKLNGWSQPADSWTIEECVFDRNGYKQNPYDATKWTSNVSAEVAQLPVGTGVQPFRSIHDRNIYVSDWDGVYDTQVTVRGSIFSRGGGGGSVQMRQGGVADRNLFIWNESAGFNLDGEGALTKDNVVLHDDHMLPPGGWGQGLTVGGQTDTTAVADSNIVAHFHRNDNGGQSIGATGSTDPVSKLLQGFVLRNAIYREFGGTGLLVEGVDRLSTHPQHPSGVLNASVTDNAVSINGLLSLQADTAKPASFTYSGNKYHSANGQFRWGWELNDGGDYRIEPFTNGTFSQWQSAGYDANATFTSDFASFKSAVGWTAPERDIVSYMQSVDPTYVVDEDVYVDADATVKQAVRQKVWEVLVNYSEWPGAMTEAQAKLTARRYHAFITFIQRAKENRKGAWDTRWTAEAVNNYIREGFGKTPIAGPYDTRSLATRLSEYAS